MWTTIQEGKAKIRISKEKKISKQLPIFYNPIMKENRDITILLLNCIENKNMQIALPLAATGIRAIRFLKELNKGKIKSIEVNDNNPKFKSHLKKNLVLSKVSPRKLKVHNKDANIFLLESLGFDYIDLDVFGSPNPFLDAAVKRSSRKGILAITATDTSAFCGTYPEACKRKYWATPKRNPEMHETGIRILIRKVQLIGAQYDRALTPILSYAREHYLRVYFYVEKGKQRADKILQLHDYYKEAGPLWTGPLHRPKLLRKMKKEADKELQPFLKTLYNECNLPMGFYNLPTIARELKLKGLPKINEIIKEIKKSKHRAAKTHFALQSIKSTISEKELKKKIKKLNF